MRAKPDARPHPTCFGDGCPAILNKSEARPLTAPSQAVRLGDAAINPRNPSGESFAQQLVIGVDTHHVAHDAFTLAVFGQRYDGITFAASPAGYKGLLGWAFQHGGA